MIRTLALLLLAAAPAGAVEPVLPPAAEETLSRVEGLGSHRVAVGPFGESLPVEIAEGVVIRRVWRVTAPGGTLSVLAPLRDGLEAEGWNIVFACETAGCGGFDFRFGIDVTEAPGMFVDLADFRYLAARRGAAWFTTLVSRSGDLAYIQTTEVDPGSEVARVTKSTSAPPPPPSVLLASEVATALRDDGRAVLSDLDFATGSSTLAGENYASLDALAAWMRRNPTARIALVGHTDAEGGAEGNMAISRRRADSARDLLIRQHGIGPDRIETHGVGYFAPIGPNDTETGREANRRVEAVITSAE